MDCRISWNIPGQLQIVWQASIVRWSASSLSTGAAHTREVSSQVKIQRIQIWREWRPCSWSFSTYPSVMIDVTENLSPSTATTCWSTIVHVQNFFSYKPQIKYFWTYVIYFREFNVEVVRRICAQNSVILCTYSISALSSNTGKPGYVLFSER
jgi:hypothetical protein